MSSLSWDPSAGQSGGGGTTQTLAINGYQLSIVPGNTVTLPSGSGTASTSMNLIVSTLLAANDVNVGSKITLLSTGVITASNLQVSSASISFLNNSAMSNFSIATDNINTNSLVVGNETAGNIVFSGRLSNTQNTFMVSNFGVTYMNNAYVSSINVVPHPTADWTMNITNSNYRIPGVSTLSQTSKMITQLYGCNAGLEIQNMDLLHSGTYTISQFPFVSRPPLANLPYLSTTYLSVSNSIFFQSNNGVLVGSNDGNLYYNNQLVNAGTSAASQWWRYPAYGVLNMNNYGIGGINGITTNTGTAGIYLNAALYNGQVGDIQLGNTIYDLFTPLYSQPKITLGGKQVNIAAGNGSYATGNSINMDAYPAALATPFFPVNSPNSVINLTAHAGYDAPAIPPFPYTPGGVGVINLTAYNSVLAGIPNPLSPGYINLNASVVNVGAASYTGIGNSAFVNVQANTIQLIGGADINPNIPPNLGVVFRSKWGAVLYNDPTIGYSSNRDSILYVARVTGQSLLTGDPYLSNYNLNIDSPGFNGVTISNATYIFGQTAFSYGGLNIRDLNTVTGTYPNQITSSFTATNLAICNVSLSSLNFSTNAAVAINTLSTNTSYAASNWSQLPTVSPIFNDTAQGVNISSAVQITGSLQNGNTGVTITNLTNATGNYPSFINSTFASQQTQINNLQISTSGGLSSIFLWSAYPAISSIYNTNSFGVRLSNVFTVTGSLDYGNTGMELTNVSSISGLYTTQTTSTSVGIQSNISINQSTMLGLTSSLQYQLTSSISSITKAQNVNTWAAYPAQSTIYSPFPLSFTNTTSNAIKISTSYLNVTDNYDYPTGVIAGSIGLKNAPGVNPDVILRAPAGTYKLAIYDGLSPGSLTSIYLSTVIFGATDTLRTSSGTLLLNNSTVGTSGGITTIPSSLTVSSLTYNSGFSNYPYTLSSATLTNIAASYAFPMISNSNVATQNNYIAQAGLLANGSLTGGENTTISYDSLGINMTTSASGYVRLAKYNIDLPYGSWSLSNVSTINGVPWTAPSNNLSTMANWSYFPVTNSNINFGNKTAWITGTGNALFTDSSNVNTIPVNAQAFVLYDPLNIGVIADLKLDLDGTPTMAKGLYGPTNLRVSTLYMLNNQVTTSNNALFVNGNNEVSNWANYRATSSVTITTNSAMFQRITTAGGTTVGQVICNVGSGTPMTILAQNDGGIINQLKTFGSIGGNPGIYSQKDTDFTNYNMFVSNVVVLPPAGINGCNCGVVVSNVGQNKQTVIANAYISTLQTQTSSINYISGDVLNASSGTLYFNGLAVDANNWAVTPAAQSVNLSGFGISNVDNVTSENFTNTGFPQTGFQILSTSARFNYQTQIYNYNAFSDYTANAIMAYGNVVAQGNFCTTSGGGYAYSEPTNVMYWYRTNMLNATGLRINQMSNNAVNQSGIAYDTVFNPLPTFAISNTNANSSNYMFVNAAGYLDLDSNSSVTAPTNYASWAIKIFPVTGVQAASLQIGYGVRGNTQYQSNFMTQVVDSSNYQTLTFSGPTTPGVVYNLKVWTNANTAFSFNTCTFKPLPN